MKSLISVSNKAINQCQKILSITQSKSLILSLKSGGCNGFEYKLETSSKDKINNSELYEKNGVKIYICNQSLLYLLGTKIDWKKDIMGESFHFENPNASSTCGCGSSFNAE